ncbi:hypothetical protein PTI98_010798 [Pleurotus ostreatus]|nr:hypothetical protein PTI98_010798 [Pleurotus ostreatus]
MYVDVDTGGFGFGYEITSLSIPIADIRKLARQSSLTLVFVSRMRKSNFSAPELCIY